ncbi:hypothetical protein AXF42_Ash018438 [Apostasia shenzhenica]|uniref:Secreted protein n=1 Tax=Apostasia shenzhenica TaxID=1088818 RepID=A0A2I0BEE0_9ASPA|nr:hypothetical protein AXF42_Ash018438 [Apostasia shenzhenica]
MMPRWARLRYAILICFPNWAQCLSPSAPCEQVKPAGQPANAKASSTPRRLRRTCTSTAPPRVFPPRSMLPTTEVSGFRHPNVFCN